MPANPVLADPNTWRSLMRPALAIADPEMDAHLAQERALGLYP